MNCKNCGIELEDGIRFCDNCGANMEEEPVEEITTDAMQEEEQAPDALPSMTLAKKAYIGGMISSIVVVILGVIMLLGIFKTTIIIDTPSSYQTTSTSYSFYGGDAYTGMQQASADASNNAQAAAENVAGTNKILAKSADGYNGIQNTVSGCMGLLTIALGAMGFFYFFVGFAKKD